MAPDFKFKASALQSVLTVSLIIILMISALTMLSSHVNSGFYRNARSAKLERNALSGLNLLLAGEIEFQDSVHLDLFGNSSDSVILKKSAWGVYEIFQVSAFKGQDTVKKRTIAGVTRSSGDDFALYLADNHLPLSVAGETSIRGKVFIPEAGIRKSYIEGKALTTENRITGITMHSESELPTLNQDVLKRLRQNFEMDSILSASQLTSSLFSLHNSFERPVYVLIHKSSLDINNISLHGNIKIICDSEIHIGSEAQLENIQIYAQSIQIESGFQGTLQIYAQDSIRLGTDVMLDYPSVLGLLRSDKKLSASEFNPIISIGEKSEVKGFVFSTWPEQDDLFPLIKIDSAIVTGQVFSSGMLQLKGKIIGTTITKGFILRTPSTIYENYVLDGTMDNDALSRYQLGNRLLNKSSIMKPLKWL